MRETGYGKTLVSALQRLAAGGDAGAARELERRGAPATSDVDVRRLEYGALRALVLAWRVQPGDTREELGRRRALAERAQVELEVRFKVDQRLYGGSGPSPVPPPVPPWLLPRALRCQPWMRPQGSKLYPSKTELARAQFNASALELYRKR